MPPRELQGIVSLPRCLDGGPIDGPVDCGDPSRRELDGKKVEFYLVGRKGRPVINRTYPGRIVANYDTTGTPE